MRVAVFLFFSAAHLPEAAWVQRLLQEMAAHKGVDYLLVYTNREDIGPLGPANLKVAPATPARLFWNRWQQQRRWRRQLEQQHIDVVFFFGLLSLVAIRLPGVLYLSEADFGKRLLQKKGQIGHLGQVMVASEKAKEKLLALPGGAGLQVSVQPGAPPRSYLVETDTGLVKDRFTDGAEYFFYNGPLHDTKAVVHLLKAFSRFKRRQKSGWKLVLVQEETGVPPALQALLSSYKFRHDVVMPGAVSNEVVQSLYAAAYCFVHPLLPEYFGTRLLQALSWGLPLIATHECRQWAGAAALYFSAGDEEKLAEHLMTLYKDEALRAKMAAAAARRAADFSWQPLIEAVLKGAG